MIPTPTSVAQAGSVSCWYFWFEGAGDDGEDVEVFLDRLTGEWVTTVYRSPHECIRQCVCERAPG